MHNTMMAVGRSCICSASISFLFLFCCLSRSLCHPSTFLFGFCRVLSDGEVAMNIDEMDLYLAICSSWMKSTRLLGLQLPQQGRVTTLLREYLTHQTLFLLSMLLDFGWLPAVTSILTLVLPLHRLQQIAFGSAMKCNDVVILVTSCKSSVNLIFILEHRQPI